MFFLAMSRQTSMQCGFPVGHFCTHCHWLIWIEFLAHFAGCSTVHFSSLFRSIIDKLKSHSLTDSPLIDMWWNNPLYGFLRSKQQLYCDWVTMTYQIACWISPTDICTVAVEGTCFPFKNQTPTQHPCNSWDEHKDGKESCSSSLLCEDKKLLN